MRVMTQKPDTPGLPKTLLGFFHLYFLLHWGTSILMFREKIGFGYDPVVRYYLGDPEMFLNPRSFQGLLEVTHFHLFAMGFFFIVYTHLLLYSGIRSSIQRILSWFLGLAIVLDLSAGYLVRYVAPQFAWVKLAAFFALQGSCLILILTLSLALSRRLR